jgi:hypothetical protein
MEYWNDEEVLSLKKNRCPGLKLFSNMMDPVLGVGNSKKTCQQLWES